MLGEDEKIWFAIVNSPPKRKTQSSTVGVSWLEISKTTSTGALILKTSDEDPSSIQLGTVLDVARHSKAVGGSYLVDFTEQMRLAEISMF